MDKSMLLEVIGDTKENRILDFLIEGKGIDYTKKEIADGCDISRPTLYKVFLKLIKEGLVRPTRRIGRVQLYSLNMNSEKIKALLKLEEILLRKSFEQIENLQTKVQIPYSHTDKPHAIRQ
ncbi:MAG: helix-turn-helix transcriptional regulator [Candidatus Aenigmarchaeota archaeon]|nr:helix-turn-helix transcriptional regulator [Candidatus Aenigmarchaeota archaeon]